jgi:hypothetical protein
MSDLFLAVRTHAYTLPLLDYRVANTFLAAYLALMSSSFWQIVLTDLHIHSRSEFLIIAHFIKAAASYDSRSYDDDCGMTFFS